MLDCTSLTPADDGASAGEGLTSAFQWGRLWLVDAATRPEPHDHFDLVMASGAVMRLRDPRRLRLVATDWSGGLPGLPACNLQPVPVMLPFRLEEGCS